MEDKISEVEGSLPLGFRFHPTDEELLLYLKLKIEKLHDKHNVDMIPEIDAYKRDPEQLPSTFFCRLKPKPSKSKRHCYNRKTSDGGYWRVTGGDSHIMGKGSKDADVEIGIMKKLVFYVNFAKNESSNWVCHEYHLNHNKDPHYVICRIKNKKEKKPMTNKKEKKPMTAHAQTISPVGCSSGPRACTSNVSGTPVNQEGDHSSFRNTLNSEVAGNQEAVNAQPETSAEEFLRPPILHPGDTLADDNLANPAGYGSLFVADFLNDNWGMRSLDSDSANHHSVDTSTDHYILENPYSPGWESGTV